jgi:hypothetical protein
MGGPSLTSAHLLRPWLQAAQVAELSRMSGAQLQGGLWAEASETPAQQPLLPQVYNNRSQD